ncbi:hypothetical protein WDZ92_06405 [Nostoc sp. NIES-2111]
MFNLSTEWTLKINTTRQAIKNVSGNYQPIPAIEPDIIFRKPIIGVYITSPSAPSNWYSAGELLQVFLVGFGKGEAEGENHRIILNRYQIIRFTEFPFYTNETQYLLSFAPKYYLRDVLIKVWEYQGTEQGISPEDLQLSLNTAKQQILSGQASIKELQNKILQRLPATEGDV